MMSRIFILTTLVAASLSPSVWASSEVVVMTVENGSREECLRSVQELLKEQGVPDHQSDGALVSDRICALENPSIALIKEKEEVEEEEIPPHAFTLDVTGGYTAGNQETGHVEGSALYEGRYGEHHSLDLKLTGEYALESDGTSYHTFELASAYAYNFDAQWSVFVLASLGRDTTKEVALVVKEVAGVMFDVFPSNDRDLKFSVGVGHQYEELLEGADAPTNSHALNDNNAIASYRIKYEERELLGEAVELIAAVWFQHILFSPGDEAQGIDPRVMDVTDFRLLVELGLKVKIADLAPGVEMYANFEGTYEYFINAVSDSPYDLVLSGGLGVSF